MLGPLKSIQGITNLALNEVKEENIIEYLKLQQKSEQKLDNALVSLIKLVSIQDLGEISKISWKEEIDNSILKAKKKTSVKEVGLEINITSKKEFNSDPIMIEMMLEELFVNSIQYNHNVKPIIKVNIVDAKEHVYIEIIDNGLGIREEEKGKVFEMFYKNEKSKGSGLGLYIAKSILEKMNGSIIFETYKNQGTNFQILLPLRRG